MAVCQRRIRQISLQKLRGFRARTLIAEALREENQAARQMIADPDFMIGSFGWGSPGS